MLAQNDGPVALIMAPTRELVQQIGKDVRRFTKALGLTCTCVYGGSGVANQVLRMLIPEPAWDSHERHQAATRFAGPLACQT